MSDENKQYKYRNGEKPWKIITGVPNRADHILSIAKEGRLYWHYDDGSIGLYESGYDLIEIQPFEDFKDGDPVMVRDYDEKEWQRKYFKEAKNGKAVCYVGGQTKWTTDGYAIGWSQCRRPTPEELG